MDFRPGKRITVFLIVFCALVFVAGQAGAADNTLVIALSSEPVNLNPIFLDMHAGNWHVFNGLVRFDADLNLEPDLASELPVVSDDGLVVTVELRDDVRFHDGEPFTAADVVFTWEALLDPAVVTPARDALALPGPVQSIEAVDDHTVRFKLARPDPAFAEKLYIGIVPSHLLAGENLNETSFNQKPVGTGPYVYDEWRPGDRLVFSANADYFDGPPGINRLVFTFVSDANARAAMLRNGSVDYTQLPPDLARLFEGDPRFQVVTPASASIIQLTLPNGNPVLADQKVRQALALAVDRQAIVDTILGGMGGPAYSPILPGHWAYDEEALIPYDPAKARALLAEAGWTETDRQGFLKKDGERLAFTVMYLPFLKSDQQVALAIRSYLAQIGVDVDVEGVDSPGYLDRVHKDAWLHNVGLPYDPDYVFWSQYRSEFANDGDPNTNRAAMKNAEVDAALARGRTAVSRDERREAYIMFQRAARDDASHLYLARQPIVVVASKDISGIEPQLMGGPHAFVRGVAWNIHRWSLER